MESFFVPGRLCLFGEHSDWAGAYRKTHPTIEPGRCLVAGTDQGISVSAKREARGLKVRSILPSGRVHEAELPTGSSSLDRAARSAEFFRYVAGTSAEIHAHYAVSGLSLQLHSNLPVQKGLSSSAAVCVATVRAYARTYGLNIDADGEMNLAYAGERRTGSECGRMDQVVAHGRSVTALRFDGDEVDVERVESRGVLHLLIVDLRREKDTRQILSDLNLCYPDASSEQARRVRTALGSFNANLHQRARTALACGNAADLGTCMMESQERFDADIAPASSALVSPRLHELLSHPSVSEFAHGGKGVGSQGDGCAQIVARGELERERLAKCLEREFAVETYPLTIGD